MEEIKIGYKKFWIEKIPKDITSLYTFFKEKNPKILTQEEIIEFCNRRNATENFYYALIKEKNITKICKIKITKKGKEFKEARIKIRNFDEELELELKFINKSNNYYFC